ncbi:uncharacterized protein LOC125883757 isoform X2 [Epinephelus fuscoguttatus]|uniref:uncharacterized protein LOC125883757 isoform X2 n=1 Tax=Epinephelus fuscoguttatus TaxID=293821 RepID=UPI0020D1A4B3|nr:uncharacterized protein LOC125883757 isoform X2 [Epinephelus fuscoguttatus]
MGEPKEEELRNVALNLVAMLRTSLSNPAANIQGQSAPQSRSARGTTQDRCQEPAGQSSAPLTAQRPSGTVQSNMARCFPGIFRQNSRSLSKKRTGTKLTPVQFFLLHSSTEKTPKPSEELKLLQAGLGKRTANVPEDAGHKEITDILCETYLKMSDLEGAWMLHKAMGGSGQRKLNLLSPEEEGYTGASLVKTWGGKGCLYIMPIQHTLDISPLPFTAPEFRAMPKARCVSCQESVPLQLLSLHVKTCTKSNGTDEMNSDDDIINLDDQTLVSTDVQPSLLDRKVACPVCSQEFSKYDIHIHASVCGESDTNEGHDDLLEKTQEEYSRISDILNSLKKKVDESQTFNINVPRENLFERGMKQWSRQKGTSPKNLLQVSFIGEYGIDQGALRKEFLTVRWVNQRRCTR